MFTKTALTRSLIAAATRCALSEADAKVVLKHKKEKVNLLKKQWKELKASAAAEAKIYEVNKKKLDKEEAALSDLRDAVDKAYEKMQKAGEEEKIVNQEIVDLLGEIEKIDPKAAKDVEKEVEQDSEVEEEKEKKDDEDEEEKDEEEVKEGSDEHEAAESDEVEKAEHEAEDKKKIDETKDEEDSEADEEKEEDELDEASANATIVHAGDKDVLVSYTTPVAYYDHKTKKLVKTNKKWSNTTSKHIGSFAKQYPGATEENMDQTHFDNMAKISKLKD